MKKDMIVLNRETWEELCESKRKVVNDYYNERKEIGGEKLGIG